MHSIAFVTLIGLVIAVFWGVGDWLIPRSKAGLTHYQIGFIAYLVGVIMYGLLFLGFSPHWPTAIQTLQIAGASVLLSAAYVVYVKALTAGPIGIVAPLGGTFPIITLLLSVVFLKQVFKGGQVLAMILIVAGAALLAYEKNYQKIPLKQLHKSTILTLCAVAAWGTAFFILNPLVPKLQWQVILFLTELFCLIFVTFSLVVMHRANLGLAVKTALANRGLLFAESLVAIGALTFYVGASRAGNIIIPSVLSQISVLITAFLGALANGERLGIFKRAGAVVVVAGIIVLNLA